MKMIGTCKGCLKTEKIDARGRACTAPCRGCGRPVKFSAIRGVETTHQCGSKCRTSRGHVCECSCGGANHGRAYDAIAESTDMPAWARSRGVRLRDLFEDLSGGCLDLRALAIDVVRASWRASQ